LYYQKFQPKISMLEKAGNFKFVPLKICTTNSSLKEFSNRKRKSLNFRIPIRKFGNDHEFLLFSIKVYLNGFQKECSFA